MAGSRPWNRRVFDEDICPLPGIWHFIDSPNQLTPGFVRRVDPAYIFFLHWSWIVPSEVVDQYECVCFHMTDLPYGRGGSPLQNLILRGKRGTTLTAFRMTSELDAGPVYLKGPLSLQGSAEEIYRNASRLSARMIERIVDERPTPEPQEGPVVTFKRRTPAESRIPALGSLESLYDFIRMLDADGYPRAFLVHEGYRYEFSRAALRDGRLVADVTITPEGGES